VQIEFQVMGDYRAVGYKILPMLQHISDYAEEFYMK